MDTKQMFLDLMPILLSNIPKSIYGDRRRVEVLAWAVVALCFTKSVNLNLWEEVVISRAQLASSRERRFSRWLHNPRVDTHAYFAPLLQAAITDWPQDSPLMVALDTSDLANGYILIRTSLVYRSRAIPVSWSVIKHASTSVSFEQYQVVLDRMLTTLPKGAKVVLLADRGFAHKKLVRYCAKNHISFRLRIKLNTKVKLSNGTIVSVSQICPD